MSGLFSGSNSQKLEDICFNSIYYGEEIDEVNRRLDRGDNILDPNVKDVIEEKILQVDKVSDVDKFKVYTSYASDFATRYDWQKYKDDLTGAKFFFNLALQIFSQQNSKLQDATIGSAALDLYKATQNSIYLEFAKYYLEKKQTVGCLSTEECADYLLFINEIKDYGYFVDYNLREQTVSFIVKKAYDNDKKLFRTMASGSYSYSVKDNSVLSALILNWYAEEINTFFLIHKYSIFL